MQLALAGYGHDIKAASPMSLIMIMSIIIRLGVHPQDMPACQLQSAVHSLALSELGKVLQDVLDWWLQCCTT